VAVGLAAYCPHAGTDVERVQPRDAGFEELAFDAGERQLLDRCGGNRDEWVTRFWCAKEAVAKATGRGLVGGPQGLAVRDLQPQNGIIKIVLGPALAAACPELQSALLIARTVRDGDLVVANTFCEKDGV
jgi:phosphopantetheinyl transferase